MVLRELIYFNVRTLNKVYKMIVLDIFSMHFQKNIAKLYIEQFKISCY